MKSVKIYLEHAEIIDQFLNSKLNTGFKMTNPFPNDFYISFVGGFFAIKLEDISTEYTSFQIETADGLFPTFEEAKIKLVESVDYLRATKYKDRSFIGYIKKEDLFPRKKIYPIGVNMAENKVLTLQGDYNSKNLYIVVDNLAHFAHYIKQKTILPYTDFLKYQKYIDQAETNFSQFFIAEA